MGKPETSSETEGTAESKIAEGLKNWQERARAEIEEAPEPESEEAITSDEDEESEQEQASPEPPELTEEQIENLLTRKEVQAKIYQQAQSMKDKELYQERFQRQQQEEQERLDSLDDEEYGEHMRQQQEQQKLVQQTQRQVAGQAMTRLLTNMQDRALSQISDEDVREQMRAKSREFQTFEDFFGACVQAEAGYQAKSQLTEREKELRKAIQKEVQAEYADQLAPELGRGIPVDQRKDLHGQQAIAEGFAEALKKKRRSR